MNDHPPEPATPWYEIRVQGRLGPRWSTWLRRPDLVPTRRRHHRPARSGHRPGRPARAAAQVARHRAPAAVSVTQTDPDRSRPITAQPTPPRSPLTYQEIPHDHHTAHPQPARPPAGPGPDAPRRDHRRLAVHRHLRHLDLRQGRLLPAAVRRRTTSPAPEQDSRVLWGAFAECILIIANIGTATALYTVVKRRYPNLGLSFIAARIMESVFIGVGILAVLTVVTLRQDYAAADDAVRRRPGRRRRRASSPCRSGPSTSGPAFVVGVGNGCILGWMMCRTGLVPRRLAVLGLIGGPLIVASGSAAVLGLIEPGGAVQQLSAAPGVLLGARPRHLPHRQGLQDPRRRHPRAWPPDGDPMITVEHVTKTYGDFTAVDDVTFTARPGRVTGFLGPNGAGKSTTMRIDGRPHPPDRRHRHVAGRRFADLPNPGHRGRRAARRVRPARRPHRPGDPHPRPEDDGPAPPTGRGDARRGRPHRQPRRAAGCGTTPWACGNGSASPHALIGDPARPHPRRAGQRAGPGRHPLDARPAARIRRPRRHRPAVLPPAARDRGHRRRPRRHRPRPHRRPRHQDRPARRRRHATSRPATAPAGRSPDRRRHHLHRPRHATGTGAATLRVDADAEHVGRLAHRAGVALHRTPRPPKAPAWRRCSSSSPPTPNEKEQRHEHHHRPQTPAHRRRRHHAARRTAAPAPHPTARIVARRAAQVVRHPLRVLAAGRHRHRRTARPPASSSPSAPDEQFTYSTFTLAIGYPMSVILPIIAVLSVTAEWTQRSGLTTFTLVPHRGRVVLAKAHRHACWSPAAPCSVAFAVGALGNLAGTAIHGLPAVWDQSASDVGLLRPRPTRCCCSSGSCSASSSAPPPAPSSPTSSTRSCATRPADLPGLQPGLVPHAPAVGRPELQPGRLVPRRLRRASNGRSSPSPPSSGSCSHWPSGVVSLLRSEVK